MEKWTTELQQQIQKIQKQMEKENWLVPAEQRPGCARSVAEALHRAGTFSSSERNICLTYDEVNTWTIHGHTTKVPNPVPGAVVFFGMTYDAIDPAGVGPEDTYTHVGILDSRVPGTKDDWYFWHYHGKDPGYWSRNTLREVEQWRNASGTTWKVYWSDFRIPKGYELEGAGVMDVLEKTKIKIFMHPNLKNPGDFDGAIYVNDKKVKGAISFTIDFLKNE